MRSSFSIPDAVQQALQLLNQAGYEAYLVGGCVRDFLLGQQPHDWDITTNAKPTAIKTVFAAYPTLETGIQHGTITVLLQELPIEITTYRTESVYSDHRHPDAVCFASQLQADLSRRDFTINALAYHPQTGLLDYVQGQRDLQQKLIRTVGNPQTRFQEDPLRILRGLRLAAVLGFQIQPQTAQAMLQQKEWLQTIAAERIQQEFSRLLCGTEAANVLRNHIATISVFLPELSAMVGFQQYNPHHIYDVWEHTLHALDTLPPNLVLRLTMLFHDCGKPQTFQKIHGIGHFYGHAQASEATAQTALQRLKFPQKIIAQVLPLIKYHDMVIPTEEVFLKRWLQKRGEAFVRQLLQIKRADNLGQHPQFHYRQQEISQQEQLLTQILQEKQCFQRKDLAIHGNDLLQLGYPQNESIGIVLQLLLDAVIQNQLPNEKEALLQKAQQYFSQI